MRTILFSAFVVVASIQASCFAQECKAETVTAEGIEALKQQIISYEQRAKQAKRKADRLMSQDFTSYRRYMRMYEQNLEIAEALKEKLAQLENRPPHLREG